MTQGAIWSAIKEKAQQENKYILLDCFTTWYRPCKMMDIEVYTNDSVGEYFSQHFIRRCLQMEKTSKDNESVKSWHDQVDEFVKNAS